MKKLSLKKLNLESGDLLKSDELKNILGGGGNCTLSCSGGTFPYNPVGSDVCGNPGLMNQLCQYAYCGNAMSCNC